MPRNKKPFHYLTRLACHEAPSLTTPRSAMPAVKSHSVIRQGSPSHSTPASTSLGSILSAMPGIATQSLPSPTVIRLGLHGSTAPCLHSLASPRFAWLSLALQSKPRLPCRALLGIVGPWCASPAKPRNALEHLDLPYYTSLCLPRRTMLCRSSTCYAKPAKTRHPPLRPALISCACPALFQPRAATLCPAAPSLPWPA